MNQWIGRFEPGEVVLGGESPEAQLPTGEMIMERTQVIPMPVRRNTSYSYLRTGTGRTILVDAPQPYSRIPLFAPV